jgi:drug/metabolite transporter, DME family
MSAQSASRTAGSQTPSIDEPLAVGRGTPVAGTVASRSWLGLALVVLATVGWSTGGVFITIVIRGSGITAQGLAFWRVLCTFLILFGAITLVRPRLLRVERRDILWLAGLGALAMGIFQVLWMASILANGLSVATVIQCNAPVLVTLLAWVFWRESLTWRKWAAIALAFAGTVLIARPAAGGNIQITAVGLLIALASALAYGGITLFTKKLAGRYQQWTILVYAFGFAALALLPLQIGRPLPTAITPQAWLAFLALLLFTTIGGYALYASALRHLQASVASIVAMTEVPLAALWGYLFLSERLDVTQIVGGLVVVSGVLLLSLRARQQG